MFGKKKQPLEKFVRMLFFAVIGIVCGVIIGFLVGLLIGWLSSLVATNSYDIVPYEFSSFLGMGFGALVGAVFGGFFGYKE